LFGELGLVLAPIAVARDPRLEDHQVRVQVNDVRWPPIDVSPDGPADDALAALVDAVGAAARRQASYLLTTSAVSGPLDRLRALEPVLVDSATSRFDPPVLTWILRDLLAESFSVRDLRNVLESLATAEGSRASALALADGMTRADVERWADAVRWGLRRQATE